ncbi:MAG: hypothetical protein E6040_09965 [Lachnospiraceae bacterium]|nr:hypothetical protein [Lachnospiraceae bacterium]
MVDKDKVLTFKSFAEKAVRKMEERKKRRVKKYYIGDLDEHIELRGLSSEELNDCLNYSEDNVLVDKYTIYYASSTLQELAKYMMDEGIIKEPLEIMDMFLISDRTKLANEVLALSGMKDKSTVSDVDELKKS